MRKLLFAPVSTVSGLLAGIAGRKLFARLWALADEEQPPKPEHSEVTWPKLLAALFLQGAIFSVVKGAVDHAARRWFAKVSGGWPGERAPKPE
jgi:hypothetical protein